MLTVTACDSTARFRECWSASRLTQLEARLLKKFSNNTENGTFNLLPLFAASVGLGEEDYSAYRQDNEGNCEGADARRANLLDGAARSYSLWHP